MLLALALVGYRGRWRWVVEEAASSQRTGARTAALLLSLGWSLRCADVDEERRMARRRREVVVVGAESISGRWIGAGP